MADIGITGRWQGDLVLAANGDLGLVDGSEMGLQRVIRRLLTPEGDLLFHEYGAGLPQKIGSTLNARAILGIVRAQMFQEAAVSQNPPPVINVEEIPPGSGEIMISVQYVDATTGAPQLLQFSL